jgi:hypothetical protein
MKLILMSILMNEMLPVFSDIYIYIYRHTHARTHLVVLVHDLNSGSSHVTTGLMHYNFSTKKKKTILLVDKMMHRKIRTFQKELVGEID